MSLLFPALKISNKYYENITEILKKYYIKKIYLQKEKVEYTIKHKQKNKKTYKREK